MKTLIHPLVAAVAVLTLNFALCAAEPVLPPKAAQLQQDFRKVPSASDSVDLTKDQPAGNAKAWSLARDFRKVSQTGGNADMARPRPLISPRDPQYDRVLKESMLRTPASPKSVAVK